MRVLSAVCSSVVSPASGTSEVRVDALPDARAEALPRRVVASRGVLREAARLCRIGALRRAAFLFGVGVAAVAVGVSGFPLQAAAQGGGQAGARGAAELPALEIGAMVEGRLTAESPRLVMGDSRFQAWRFEARAGDRLRADARASAFDPYLVLGRIVGGITEFIREDDDGGEGTDARILYTVEEDGSYVLVVRSWSSEAVGPFTLSLTRRGPAPDPVVRPIALGQAIEGRLDSEGATLETEWGQEIPFDLWTFEGTAGDGVQISLEAEGFDAYLELGQWVGGDFVVEAWDDDGGEGLNSLLRHVLERSGTYHVRARPLGTYLMDGAYTLTLSSWVPAPPVRRPLEIGAPVSGVITPDDAVLPDGAFVQEWVLEAGVGAMVRIRMRSEALDSFLSVGWEDEAGNFVEVASNDDAPDDGLNAMVELTLDRPGPWIIRARPLHAGVVGPYTIEVVRVEG